MERKLNGLKPEAVFRFFEDITRIPHGSYNETAIAAFLCKFAEDHGLAHRTDDLHNVLIVKDATPGYEKEPTIMLQGHTDMVCQKVAGSAHNFETDPLSIYIEDGWITADGTTLGGDDGIAVAMMLAILEDDTLAHPRLECLFTVQEEVGLDGALGFDYTGVEAKMLINIDSEADGIGTVSCAGGARIDITKPVSFTKEQAKTAVIRVSGLKGGHSGAEIHLPRGNAHRIVGQMLEGLSEKVSFRLASVNGGNMDNAIPRECEAVLAYAPADEDAVRETLESLRAAQTEILSEDDRAGGSITVSYADYEGPVMTADDTMNIIGLLCLTPNGVATMCEDLPDLVESSCNMGILYTTEKSVCFGFLARAAVEERKADLRRKLFACAKLCGAEIVVVSSYPGWAYDKHSEAAKRYSAVYEKLFGKKPVIEAIHAGLECGLIKAAVPGIDPISIGPDMQDIHTPDERLNIASVGRVYSTVLAMLAEKE